MGYQIHYSVVQYSVVQCSAVQCSAMLRSTAQHDWTVLDSLDITVAPKCTMFHVHCINIDEYKGRRKRRACGQNE
jgi:ribosomal protein L31